MKTILLQRILPPVIPLIASIAIAELLVRGGVIRPYLLPAPSRVFATLVRDWPELWTATWETSKGAITGLAMSIVIGVVIALALSSSRWIQRAFYPYAVFFQTVPIIAIAPLLVIWVGYGMPTVIASACIVSVFPVIANSLTGLLSTDPNLVDLFRLYGSSRLAMLWRLRLPSALPSIFTGFRIAAGLAVIGAIVGEFIGGGGIGSIIDASKTQQRIDRVFAGLLLASALGLTLFWTINLASWLALRHWHASERDN